LLKLPMLHPDQVTDPLHAYQISKRGNSLRAAKLISDVGFDPVDTGPLRMARYLEPFALLMGQLAYEGDGGPEIAYRFERFESRSPRRGR